MGTAPRYSEPHCFDRFPSPTANLAPPYDCPSLAEEQRTHWQRALEPRVSQVVAAIARMGYVTKAPDGRFRIGRAA